MTAQMQSATIITSVPTTLSRAIHAVNSSNATLRHAFDDNSQLPPAATIAVAFGAVHPSHPRTTWSIMAAEITATRTVAIKIGTGLHRRPRPAPDAGSLGGGDCIPSGSG